MSEARRHPKVPAANEAYLYGRKDGGVGPQVMHVYMQSNVCCGYPQVDGRHPVPQLWVMGVVQAWQEHGFAFEWAKEAGLDVRGLRFAQDVRRQLDGITGPNGSHLLGMFPTSPPSTPNPSPPHAHTSSPPTVNPQSLPIPHARTPPPFCPLRPPYTPTRPL